MVKFSPPAPMRVSWRRSYPLLGMLLALGAPAGLLLVRSFAAGRSPTLSFAVHELEADRLLYGYLFSSTAAVFAILGWKLGGKEDALAVRALTDPLTGLCNRIALEGRLGHELARWKRYGTPLSLLLLDVDGLKLLNDHLGHAHGDVALRRLADTLRQVCRASDLAARIGGDEFVVVAASTKAQEALTLAERIRSELRAGGGTQEVSLSVSIGIADVEHAPTADPSKLIAAADCALYQAKRGGRDRVVLAATPPDGQLPEPSRLSRKAKVLWLHGSRGQ